ncbi:MAG: thiamine pyrophosphokinase, partial [Gemmatimonadaceae bacterium]|nr:thiamine pyrophosphokinase [Acetobacteraceae bacterium]
MPDAMRHPDLMRHVEACNNAVLPGRRAPLWLEHGQIGWVRPDAAAVLGG